VNVVLVLGAGASYGSGECDPKPPPLGKDLFQELNALGGVASLIASPLRDEFEKDFEQGMASLREDNHGTVELLREMATYFVRFKLGTRNVYRQLATAIQKSPHVVTLVTTNYDLLLDEAICAGGSSIDYLTRPTAPNCITLLKIHGSVNFVPDLGGITIDGMTYGGSNTDTMIASGTKFLLSGDEILEFMSRQFVAPSIAVYAPGKAVPFAPKFVKEVQEHWRQAVTAADTIFVIGLRVLPADGHIWDTLAAASGLVTYVGGEPAEFLAWADAVHKKSVEILGPRKFADAMPSIEARLVR
jgi:hypothetical protein